MQLYQLPSPLHRKRHQRVGRGGKRGTTSGRGQKGQKSRAGHRIRPATRDLVMRIPKLRGFRNKPKSEKALTVDIFAVARKARPLAMSGKPVLVDGTFLKSIRLVPLRHKGSVKLLGSGDLGVALSVTGILLSQEARASVERAGGKIV